MMAILMAGAAVWPRGFNGGAGEGMVMAVTVTWWVWW